MSDVCHNEGCPTWHGAAQHHCTLGHNEFFQCPDRADAPITHSSPTAVSYGAKARAHLDGEASLSKETEPQVDTATIKRFRVFQHGRVIATWYEDDEGNSYRPS